MKVADTSRESKPPSGNGTSKNEKLSKSKSFSSALVKKSNDGKNAEAAASNGSVGMNPQSKQSFTSRSFSDKQPHLSKLKVDITLLFKLL